MNLDEAADKWRSYEGDGIRYVDFRNPNPDDELWRATWFPVLWGNPADIVVECEAGSDGPAPVRRVENAPTVPLGPAAPIIFPSLTELVAAAIRSIRQHSYWDSGGTLQLRDGSDGRIEQ